MQGPPGIDVLLIEDDPVFQRAVAAHLADTTHLHFSLATAPTVAEAMPILADRPVDIVLLDLNLPDAGGLDALERVRRTREDLPIVILTGSRPDHEAAVSALAMGAQDYLVKSDLDRDRLVRSIRYALERQRIHETLESTLRELERANRDLAEFASVVGHDLKAPIRGISIIVEDLLSKEGTDRDALQRIQDRLDLMRRLIDGVHEYARVGQDARPVQVVETSEVVRQALKLVSPPSGFRIDVEPGLPRLRTNATQLGQVFQNLIGNAVRHHGGASGRVRVGWIRRGADGAFFVEDDGPGLPPGLLNRLFQGGRPKAAPAPRQGLGLVIVEKLVHLNGGELTVQSSPSTGSRFEFTWPPSPTRRAEPPLA